MIDQKPMSELLRRTTFKQFTIAKPSFKSKSWRVYAKVNGRWCTAQFDSWAKALNYAIRRRWDWEDWAVNCTSHETMPPRVRIPSDDGVKLNMAMPVPAGHRWCGYCRRPTVFGFYRSHHAITSRVTGELRPAVISSSELRCSICGCRDAFLKRSRRR